jgi:hypothetical protein
MYFSKNQTVDNGIFLQILLFTMIFLIFPDFQIPFLASFYTNSKNLYLVKIFFYPMDGEKILGAVYGVLGTPWPGQWTHPPQPDNKYSNVILFTNKRLFLMFIRPSSKVYWVGGDKYLMEAKQKVEEMISAMTPEEIYSATNHHAIMPKLIKFDEIKELKLNKKNDFKGSVGDAFYIKTLNKKQYRYYFKWDAEVDKLEKILTKILPSKTIIKSGKILR